MNEQSIEQKTKNVPFQKILSTQEIVQEEIASLERAYQKISSSPEETRAFLQRAGILGSDGHLSEHYQDKE